LANDAGSEAKSIAGSYFSGILLLGSIGAFIRLGPHHAYPAAEITRRGSSLSSWRGLLGASALIWALSSSRCRNAVLAQQGHWLHLQPLAFEIQLRSRQCTSTAEEASGSTGVGAEDSSPLPSRPGQAAAATRGAPRRRDPSAGRNLRPSPGGWRWASPGPAPSPGPRTTGPLEAVGALQQAGGLR